MLVYSQPRVRISPAPPVLIALTFFVDMTQAVFLDRDGTLNIERGYLREVEQLDLYTGAAKAVKRLNDAGILTFLTTNQSGPARGFYDEDHVKALLERLETLLWNEAEAKLDGLYYCPHHPRGVVEVYKANCRCRKPEIGMIKEACNAHPNIDLANSYVIGDKATDVELGVNAGAKSILLKTGYGQRVLEGKYQSLEHTPTHVCEDITHAVDVILGA